MDYNYVLELLLKHLDEGILVVDINANVIFFNEPAKKIAGIDQKEAMGKNILNIFSGLTADTSTFYHVLGTGKPLIDYVQNYVNYQGKKVSIVTSTIPIIINEELIGAIEIYRDFTSVKELSDKIYSLEEKLFSNKSDKKQLASNGTVYNFDDIIGKSQSIKELKGKALRIADSESPVLVYGETGTGKELLVQAIHNASTKRRCKPFIAQNCAALPENLLESILFGTSAGSFTGAKDKQGIFELANGGTLFLDEINSMNFQLQAKLLRVLQDGVIRRIGGEKAIAVDVRVITALNENPITAVENKCLREDLYYRLNVISLCIPPLRDRKEDISTLVSYFIDMYNKKLNKEVKGISSQVMDIFMKNQWAGNVRELKHAIESIMNFTDKDIIDIEHMPSNIINYFLIEEKYQIKSKGYETIPLLNEALIEYEKILIKKALEKANGNYSKTAKMLGLPRQTLYNKIKKYNINWIAKVL
ncbi:MAG: sigma 54-interacting transcriptional regulator [Lutispora sp.]|nr:sigma 54-interacting transcriptional regulator [Bacteroidales bacterium]